MRRHRIWSSFAAVAVVAALAGPATAQSDGRAFAPRPLPPERFGISAQTATTQNTTITGADGTEIYIEWWLPTDELGEEPPSRLPVVAQLSPYLSQGALGSDADTMELVVRRGYAYATVHSRGTGLSGGCQEQFSSAEIDDMARAIEWLGRDAPFSDGNIGTSGLSYPGILQVAVAGRGDPERVKYLKAIIAGGVATSQYDYNFFDGVPFTAQGVAHSASYNVLNSLPSPGTRDHPVERVACVPGIMAGSADFSGDMTPFWADREHRVGAPRTTAAVLLYHGHRDEIDREIALAGYVDRLPETTPRHIVIGSFGHAFPDDVRGQTPWPRADWDAMKLAWLDRYVRGDETAGVEQWPTVEVQDSQGQWRGEPSWPTSSGLPGTLALSAGGELGATTPSGSSQFIEGLWTETPQSRAGVGDERGRLVWTTTPVAEGEVLHVTGQPVLDMWVQLDRPDAHLAARIDAIDANGSVLPYATAMGFRSMQHLDPLVEGRFAQAQGRPAPILTPIHVQLRFDPASIVVPEGARLRLTLAGSLTPNSLTASQPSGLGTIVTVLHDCAHPSVLTFQTLAADPDLLNVEEEDEGPPVANPVGPFATDGGGMASAPVCGG